MNAAPCRFPPAVDSSLRDRLSRNAREIIDAAGIECVVGVGHPSHFALAGAHVRARNVFTWADIFLADQLCREPAGDLFELFFRVFLRIETDAALRAAKRHINNGAFVGHQGSQRHDLIPVYKFAESRAAFNRLLVLAVLCPPAFENFVMISAETHRELEVVNVVARLDLG